MLPGSFNGPAGIAVNQQGEILVAELLNHRIQKLFANGQPVAQWGTFGEEPGQFRDPIAVTVDSDGNLYVADKGNDRIKKLGPDGRPLAQWGGSGQLSGPTGVALDAQGNVYVADPATIGFRNCLPTASLFNNGASTALSRANSPERPVSRWMPRATCMWSMKVTTASRSSRRTDNRSPSGAQVATPVLAPRARAS